MTETIIIDTNILARYVLNDDIKQSPIAQSHINNKQYHCIIPIQTFCELDWVLRKKVKIQRSEVIDCFEDLATRANISFNRDEFERGLYFLKNGGDFADGIIAYQAQHHDVSLLTFDQKAQNISKKLNIAVISPSLN